MRVLLVHPRTDASTLTHRQEPLGLAYLASCIRTDYEVGIHDEAVEDETLEQRASRFAPDVLGVSFTTLTAKRAYGIAQRFRSDCMLIAGGIHPTLNSTEAIDSGFHYVITGAGEDRLCELLSELANKRGSRGAPFDYALSNSCTPPFVRSGSHGRFAELTPPSRDLLPMHKYDHGAVMTGRGCRHHCVYCSSKEMYGGHYARRPVESVIGELKSVVNQYNKGIVHICDDTFTEDHNYVKALCRAIRAEALDFRWSALTRCDAVVDAEMLHLMKEAGCALLIFGVESGSEQQLKVVRKGIAVGEMEDAIIRCMAVGIQVKTTWIVGLPGGMDEQWKSLQLMKRLTPHQISVHLCVPYPGSELYREAARYGINVNTNMPAAEWGAFCPSYVPLTPESLRSYFSYSYATFESLFDMITAWRCEMQAVGYGAPSAFRVGDRERTFKTFLDKERNELLKEAPNASTGTASSARHDERY